MYSFFACVTDVIFIIRSRFYVFRASNAFTNISLVSQWAHSKELIAKVSTDNFSDNSIILTMLNIGVLRELFANVWHFLLLQMETIFVNITFKLSIKYTSLSAHNYNLATLARAKLLSFRAQMYTTRSIPSTKHVQWACDRAATQSFFLSFVKVWMGG